VNLSSCDGWEIVESLEYSDPLASTRRFTYDDQIRAAFVSLRTSPPAGLHPAWARRVSLQVGAGIVADSDPAKEYEETLHKAQAFFSSLR